MEAGKISNDQIHKIVESLEGTCKTMDQIIIQVTDNDGLTEEDITESQMTYIDQTIFKCSDCGWWFEMAEETKSEHEDEMGCRECNPEEEDDENEDY